MYRVAVRSMDQWFSQGNINNHWLQGVILTLCHSKMSAVVVETPDIALKDKIVEPFSHNPIPFGIFK